MITYTDTARNRVVVACDQCGGHPTYRQLPHDGKFTCSECECIPERQERERREAEDRRARFAQAQRCRNCGRLFHAFTKASLCSDCEVLERGKALCCGHAQLVATHGEPGALRRCPTHGEEWFNFGRLD